MDDHSSEQDKKTDWAEARTDWAEDRTVMANERTFAGWMRTGMAAIAVAVGLRAVFDEADLAWIAKVVATLFVGGAVLIFWSARRQAVKAQVRLDSHAAEPQDSRTFTVMSVLFSICAIAVGGILWAI
jgi:putative membrane protein